MLVTSLKTETSYGEFNCNGALRTQRLHCRCGLHLSEMVLARCLSLPAAKPDDYGRGPLHMQISRKIPLPSYIGLLLSRWNLIIYYLLPTPSRVGGPCKTASARVYHTVHTHFEVVTRRYDESHCPREHHQENFQRCPDTCIVRGEVDPSSCALESGWAPPDTGPTSFLINDMLAKNGTNRKPSTSDTNSNRPLTAPFVPFFLLSTHDCRFFRRCLRDCAYKYGPQLSCCRTARFMPQPLVSIHFVSTKAKRRYHGLAL